jgi:hypothetical protein
VLQGRTLELPKRMNPRVNTLLIMWGDLEKVVASKEGRVRLIKHEIIITCKSISGTLSETPRVSQLVEHAINTIRIVLLGYIPGKRLHTW